MKYQRPTKAVIAAAGFGTRFLPQTKAMPKEMLPIIDKPIIQYIVEELVEAGIKDIIIVTGHNKRSIEDHFDVPTADLAATLESGGKGPALARLHEISNMANFIYIRQKEALGNAAPLLYAGHLINDGEPFIYTWGDDFIGAEPSRFKQMIAAYEKTKGSIVSCVPVHSDEDYDRYGVVAGEKTALGDNLLKMSTIKEKPGKQHAPSNLASVSGYLFTSEIIEYVQKLAETHTGEGELNIQGAMQAMIDDGHDYFACDIQNGTYYDAGNKLQYIKTVIDFALRRDDIGEDVRRYLAERISK
jgi:UTP--glucose-1-phosphate uridylyltransferase